LPAVNQCYKRSLACGLSGVDKKLYGFNFCFFFELSCIVYIFCYLNVNNKISVVIKRIKSFLIFQLFYIYVRNARFAETVMGSSQGGKMCSYNFSCAFTVVSIYYGVTIASYLYYDL